MNGTKVIKVWCIFRVRRHLRYIRPKVDRRSDTKKYKRTESVLDGVKFSKARRDFKTLSSQKMRDNMPLARDIPTHNI